MFLLMIHEQQYRCNSLCRNLNLQYTLVRQHYKWTVCWYLDKIWNKIIYYKFSLLHIFSLVLQPWMSAYIRKTDGYIFQSPKTIKTWMTKHYASLNQRYNKCIFTKLNAVFILKTAAWTKKILQRLIPSQIPDRFSKLLCSTAVP